jgi:hypothetical protein
LQALIEGLIGAAEKRSLPGPDGRDQLFTLLNTARPNTGIDLTPFRDRLEKCESAQRDAGTSESQACTACPTPAPAARDGRAQSPELSIVADVLMSALHASANGNSLLTHTASEGIAPHAGKAGDSLDKSSRAATHTSIGDRNEQASSLTGADKVRSLA